MSLKWLAVELFVIKPLNLCQLSELVNDRIKGTDRDVTM